MNEHEILCPACDSVNDIDASFLGQLGWLTHYRCRYCGITFSQSPLSRDIEALAVAADTYLQDEGGEA